LKSEISQKLGLSTSYGSLAERRRLTAGASRERSANDCSYPPVAERRRHRDVASRERRLAKRLLVFADRRTGKVYQKSSAYRS